MNIIRFIFLVLLSVPSLSLAQSQATERLTTKPWTATWISYPKGNGEEYGVYYFRKDLTLPALDGPQWIGISADNRYKLYINGHYVTNGPARGDQWHWRFETIDLSPYLKPGNNSVQVIVWNYGSYRPVAQHTAGTGLIIEGPDALKINTDRSWKVRRDPAYSPLPIDVHHQYYVVGPGEFIDMTMHPFDWMSDDLQGKDWKTALEKEHGIPVKSLSAYGSPPSRILVPRNIPLMEEKEQRFASVREVEYPEQPEEKGKVADKFLSGKKDLIIPADQHIRLLVDQGYLTNAYPFLHYSGGKGASLSITYAESLYNKNGDKGNRNVVRGKTIFGNRDSLLLDGGTDRRFESLWWRTFRYVQLNIHTSGEPLVLHDLHSRFTGYPFAERASFDSDYPPVHAIWEAGWRTQRLCAMETFFDCPYYEQLEYIGDSRIQGLVSTYVSGDTLLLRNALTLMNDSRMSFGLTQSRYPSYQTQVIPTFSLVYITMIRDYYRLCLDDQFIRSLLPGTLEILDWFEKRMDSTGMVHQPEWWNFVDWVSSWPSGVPPGVDNSYSAVLNLQFAYTLLLAAELYDDFQLPGQAAHCRKLAADINRSVELSCFVPSRGLIADTPEKNTFSQHANALAVLTGLFKEDDAPEVMEQIRKEEDLAPCSFYFTFYLVQAMQKAGVSSEYMSTLAPWEHMLEMGLTTFAEAPAPSRSDCHAWSASPLYYFLSLVCGIQPGTPGFQTVKIAPALGELRQVSGEVPHREGMISVAYNVDKKGRMTADIVLPGQLTGAFYWKEKEYSLRPGSNHFQVE